MNIGIISLGLIGGSLFKSLCKTDNDIYAVTTNINTIEKAKIHSKNVSCDIKILSDCDMVFVASPINKTQEMLDKLENVVSENCIVLDCCSVKEFVMKKKRPYKFIGSHPMAGTELNGYDASFGTLFCGAKWVLTPSSDIKEEDIEKAENIIMQTGAQPVIADAKEHDFAVALISHMPMFISRAIFNTAKDNKLALKLASSGFRDMTRLCLSNIEMSNDMMIYNKENIDKSLDMLNNSIEFLKNPEFFKNISDIKNIREKMYSKEGKNIL